ncbi:MAG TPA: MBL fold metallo-hydrolase [Pyrinomonadaceae bacterium]|nr:MBL fold metallo-hydrolase [Pyrinomonadaceae bacterium]
MRFYGLSISRLVVCFVAVVILSLAVQAEMKMHVINVGQAEAILFEFRNHAILVDAGSHKDSDTTHLFEYLDRFFNGRPDLNKTLHSVVVSHPHIDHTKNLPAVFQRYKVLHFVEGGGPDDSLGIRPVKEVRAILAQEPAKHHKIYARDVKRPSFMRSWREELMNGSEVDVRFLSAGRRCNDENNASLVMRVEYKGKSFLVIGDAEEEDTENGNVGCGGLLYRLLDPVAAFPELLDIDVYKVGHHGSRNGTIDALLEKVKPAFAVISAGDNRINQVANSFSAWDHGHPNERAVKRLEGKVERNRTPKNVTVMRSQESAVINRLMRKAIYSTGWDGDIVFTVSATGNLEEPTISN